MADQQRRGDLHRGLGPDGLEKKNREGREGNTSRLKGKGRFCYEQFKPVPKPETLHHHHQTLKLQHSPVLPPLMIADLMTLPLVWSSTFHLCILHASSLPKTSSKVIVEDWGLRVNIYSGGEKRELLKASPSHTAEPMFHKLPLCSEFRVAPRQQAKHPHLG